MSQPEDLTDPSPYGQHPGCSKAAGVLAQGTGICRINRRTALFGVALSCFTHSTDAADSPSRDSRDLITPETEAAITHGLEWLTRRQQPDGVFGPTTALNRYRLNPAVNALCGLALLSSGSTPGRGPFGAHLDHLIDLLLDYAGPTGFITEPDTEYDQSPMYGHGFAATFLAEVYGMTDRRELRGAVSRAVQLIIDTQNREGGWRYAPEPRDADISVTVCQMMALRAAHNTGIAVPREVIDRGVAYISRCQNPDGGFRYQALTGGASAFPRSAAAVAALYSSGINEGPVVEAATRYLQQFQLGARGITDRGYYFYALYYGIQAAWQAEDEMWRSWYAALRNELLNAQLSDGHWVDPVISPEYATAMALIVLQFPNGYLPIFQR